MALIKGTTVKNGANVPYPGCAGAVVASIFSHTFKAAPAVGDVIELSCLPNGCKPVDFILVSDDLDNNGAPTIQFDLGIMSGEFGEDDQARTCGAELLSASQVARAGGIARPSTPSAFRVAPATKDRGVGLKITALPAGFQQGTVTLTLLYASF